MRKLPVEYPIPPPKPTPGIKQSTFKVSQAQPSSHIFLFFGAKSNNAPCAFLRKTKLTSDMHV